MADQNSTDEQEVTQGGIEHVLHDVEIGEEIPGEHPDEAYQFRQKIVDPDKLSEAETVEQQSGAPSGPPPPLPPPESE